MLLGLRQQLSWSHICWRQKQVRAVVISAPLLVCGYLGIRPGTELGEDYWFASGKARIGMVHVHVLPRKEAVVPTDTILVLHLIVHQLPATHYTPLHA
jgi:hypothetical protein